MDLLMKNKTKKISPITDKDLNLVSGGAVMINGTVVIKTPNNGPQGPLTAIGGVRRRN